MPDSRAVAMSCSSRLMADPPRLPPGLTPRLLSREAAAAYCGVSPGFFDDTIGREVPPIAIRSKKLWDIKALDRWVDDQPQGAKDRASQSIRERLNGDSGAGAENLPQPR